MQAPATDDVEFVVVMNEVDYGDGIENEDTTIGFDLDGQCTMRGDPPNCTPHDWTNTDLTDGSHGEDNGVGKLITRQSELFGDQLVSSENLNERVAMGVDAPLGVLRVSNYGGMIEDDRVRVEWFMSVALGQPAALDASDRWPIVAAEDGESEVVFVDNDAFVTKRTLVAHFDEASVALVNVYIDLKQVVLTAKVDLVDGAWTLRAGTIGAWLPVDSLLGAVPTVALSLFKVPQCTDDEANYPLTKKYICSLADLPPFGETGPEAPCDRSSAGVNFEAVPASLGALTELPPRASPCPPETDPQYDTCRTPP